MFSRKAALEILYFLKYILEISYRNKDKINAKYRKGVTLDFCFILLASNTVIWASLVGAHRSKLEVEDFVFHVVVFSRETFQTLAWKLLLCVLQKVFGVYIFPNFVPM